MGLGISATDWSNLTNDYVISKTYALRNRTTQNSYQDIDKSYNNQPVVSSTTGNYCTDGVDDGDIGVGGIATSLLKGAGKSLVNSIKGCFTDNQGKFSIKKTLISAGAVALCCAVPAVGVAACGLGILSGGTNIIEGLRNASNAKTDAAKKDALENIGDGAFTAITSAVGLKASIGAVKATSTVGKLSALDDNATMLQKLGALGQDMVSSTKNNTTKAIDAIKAGDITNKAHSAIDFLHTLKSKVSVKNAKSMALEKVENIPDTFRGFNFKELSTNLKKSPITRLNELKAKLSPKAQTIIDFLKNEDASISKTTELVQKFGYKAVMEVLEAFMGYRVLDESV